MIIKQAYLPLIGRVCFFLDRYTDTHDISEDVTTISVVGGRWGHGLGSGAFHRYLVDVPSASGGHIASRSSTIDRHDILINTDLHDIDEDIRTISSFNGCHMDGVIAGIFYRFLFDVPSVSFSNVASRLRNRIYIILVVLLF